ncbi:RimK family alpha-L-glutamate ligase [Haladaptatus salinisoli]|uniref:RimK family alpha-L-glutamate ligase n=1 Tax=Haladaptatus salinisoli TaxID=2884876 RepID=UPI001D0A0FB5|nr:RimK family alpha-L-glutamate ligase [Haladaptatus salinisoli]
MAADGSPVRVGVLSLHNSKETKAICNAIQDLGHRPEWLRQENTAVEIRDGEVTLEPEIDIVANRLLLSNTEQPSEALGLANIYDSLVPVLNRPDSVMTAIHKFSTATSLADAGIPVPDALLALDNNRLNDGRAQFGDEAVYKTAIGTHGGGTWKVGADEMVNPRVGERQAFLQELIERDEKRHCDLRVYVVGDRIVGAMNRYAPENDWRTNVALGGDVEDMTDELPDEAAEIARRATEIVGLDYAGVDLIEGHDGWHVLEVNPTAGFKGLYKATGRSAAPYIAQVAIERAGGEVNRDRVDELTATLDDSTPDCKPTSTSPPPTEPVVIGYTEEVLVSGTSGSETVVAKSDTGATRSSIDTKLAAQIGAGPIKSMTRVKSGSRKASKSRPVVDVVIGVGGNRHTVTASIEDRGHMDYPVLLGRDILSNYQVDVRRRVDDDEAEREEEEEETEG